MNLSLVRNMLEARRRQPWGGSMSSEDSSSPSSPTPTISTQLSDDDLQQESVRAMALSDGEMLERARAAHDRANFAALSAGPEANGPWKRVESANSFVVFRRPTNIKDGHHHGLEVMCAGRLDASIEEVSSILRSHSESEHNASMSALYTKSFIFGSYEREVKPPKGDNNEQLVVKTKSFARTTMLGHNEQWCYFDFFQRKKERDGFTISKRALPPSEVTPGRIVGSNAHVDQLHGLNASYLVDKLPDRKGLRVVFHAWFDSEKKVDSSNRRRARSNPSSPHLEHKAQLRRLLAMAHGITKIPELVRRRRFGVQVPAKLDAIETFNSRCPCCTHSLAPVKLSLSKAASAIKNRSLAPVKLDTRRCYLCGYLVCVDCWTSEHMENFAGRVAAIVVCTRCQANVQACEYSEVFAGTAEERERHRGPPRVVEDSNNSTTVSLLVDFLSASLLNAAAGSREHAAVVTVIRTLLNQDEEESEDNQTEDPEAPGFQVLEDYEVNKLGEFLSDEEQLPMLEDCKLGNADERSYPLDLPDDPTMDVPQSPIPSNEAERMESIKSEGLLEIANIFAPETPLSANVSTPAVHDLELLCNLAVKTLDCAYSFVTVMCAKHEHVMIGTHPGFVGAAVPRAQTTCQHALMSPYPFMAAHHEADVRLHKLGASSAVPIRFYVGFPLTVDRKEEGVVTVGMLCCIDSKPRAEMTRTQYATMKRLASTASHFLLQKSRQLQQHNLSLSGGCL